RGTIRDDAAALLASGIDAVLHFAAKSLVGESMENPSLYWESNLGGTLALLEPMHTTKTPRIVFSSTAAFYGEPETTPIPETAPTRPTSPYGASKLAVDTALAEYARMHGIGGGSLRDFKVAGADEGSGGPRPGGGPPPGTHPTPPPPPARAAGKAARADRHAQLFGDDYPTPDGTCVRDYIHVADLAHAHLLALDACAPGQHRIYNLGVGNGFSNREVLDMCRELTGQDIPAVIGPRRPGDPAVL